MAAIDLKKTSHATIAHCSAHAERKKTRGQWTRQDLGNYIADRAADRDYTSIASEYPQFTYFEDTALQVASQLAARSDWLITDKNGSPCVLSLKKRQRSAHYREYVSERDDRHHPADPSYREASSKHAAVVWRIPLLSIPGRARALRIIYHKAWLPWNVARFGAHDHEGADGLCPICGDIDSPKHLICNCQDLISRQIRADGKLA